jgi:hypothetical protein
MEILMVKEKEKEKEKENVANRRGRVAMLLEGR